MNRSAQDRTGVPSDGNSEGMDVEGRALAKAMFPREWAQAELWTGKRRQRKMASLRARAKEETARKPLRVAGASCATCAHRLKNPGGLKGLYCELDSDFHGYTSTEPQHLCSRYEGPRGLTPQSPQTASPDPGSQKPQPERNNP